MRAECLPRRDIAFVSKTNNKANIAKKKKLLLQLCCLCGLHGVSSRPLISQYFFSPQIAGDQCIRSSFHPSTDAHAIMFFRVAAGYNLIFHAQTFWWAMVDGTGTGGGSSIGDDCNGQTKILLSC